MKMTMSFCIKQKCQVNEVEQGIVSQSPNKELLQYNVGIL